MWKLFVCAFYMLAEKELNLILYKSAFKILNNYNYSYEAWIGPSISKNYYLVNEEYKMKLFD